MSRDIQLLSSSTSLDVMKVEDRYGCSPMQGSIIGLWKEECVWDGYFGEIQGSHIFRWLLENPTCWMPDRSWDWFGRWMIRDQRSSWANIRSNLLVNDIQQTSDYGGVNIFKMGPSGWTLEDIDKADSPWFECFRDHLSGNQTTDDVRCEVVDRILTPGGPWRRCFGETIPFASYIPESKNPIGIPCPGSPEYPTLLVSFIPRRSVGRVRMFEVGYSRSFHFSGEALWFRWPFDSYNKQVLESRGNVQLNISVIWACSNLMGLRVIWARPGEVTENGYCSLCALVTITDTLFVRHPYTIDGGFKTDMEWLREQKCLTT